MKKIASIGRDLAYSVYHENLDGGGWGGSKSGGSSGSGSSGGGGSRRKGRGSLRVSSLLKNKTRRSWIPDWEVDECMRCGTEFTLLLRKSHCRLCGRIFCHSCVPFRKKIPVTWNHDPKMEGIKVKMCGLCSQQVEILEDLEVLINVFSVVVPDLEMLYQMARVSHLWNNLASYFLGKLRNIQYKTMDEKLTELERALLWKNRKYWAGHANWGIWLLKSLDYQSFEFRNNQLAEYREFLETINKNLEGREGREGIGGGRKGCWYRMCSGRCHQRMRGIHGVVLMEWACRSEVDEGIYQLVYRIFKEMDIDELRHFLPVLVDKLVYQKIDRGHALGDLLVNEAMKDEWIGMEMYWLLRYKFNQTGNATYQYYWTKLLHHMPQYMVKRINDSDMLVKRIHGSRGGGESGGEEDLFDIKKYFRKHERSMIGLPVPYNLNMRVKGIQIHQLKIMSSATRPLLIPMICGGGGGGVERDVTLLYKFENVRQDYLILKAIRLMKYILHEYHGIDLETVDYKVLPVDETSGLIEIVPECSTAYDIKEKQNYSILNYIIDHNPDVKVEELRKRFVKSAATYCIISYLLAIQDRHLENIMITQDGRLFHIDYGYIFGTDPKPISQPKIRITKDMVDALGGITSPNYEEFIKLTNGIYQALRYQLNTFIAYFSPLYDGNEPERERVVKLLRGRFMPGEDGKRAIIQLQSEIHRSVGGSNLGEVVSDFFHYHNKEETVKNWVNSSQKAVVGLGSGALNYGEKVGGMLGKLWGGGGGAKR